MSPDISEIKSRIVEACHRLSSRKLVANHDGNITVKIGEGRFLATPTSFAKMDVTVGDILTVGSDGQVIEGKHKSFSEIFNHLAIYRTRPDVLSIVHAHPPVASGFGLAGREIGTPALPEAIVSLGKSILTSCFFSPLDPSIKVIGSVFEKEMKRVLSESDAFVAIGNGAWSVGQEVSQAYLRMELVEHVAVQHLIAEQLGQVRALPAALIEELLKKRMQKPNSLLSREHIKNIVKDELQAILGPR